MTLMTIDSIAAGGEGVGRLPDGRVAFVSRTSPGDVVEVVEVDEKPRYVRAKVISLKTPGPDRVDPECVHYTRDGCGGCQLQHLAPKAQLRAKRRVVGDALRRIAGLNIDDPEIVASDDAWRYRSKITLTARTTHQGRRVFGLHRYATPGVFEPSDCLITRERVMALWGRLRDHGKFFPPNTESVTLREDRDGGYHVVFAAGTPQDASQPAAGGRVLIPSDCVVRVDGHSGVFLLERDVVHFLALETVPASAARVLVQSGLEGGERIILSPPFSLADGDRVRIKE